jgi:hypothetical protein
MLSLGYLPFYLLVQGLDPDLRLLGIDSSTNSALISHDAGMRPVLFTPHLRFLHDFYPFDVNRIRFSRFSIDDVEAIN